MKLKEPHASILAECDPRLRILDFSLVDEGTYGATFIRPNGVRLILSIETHQVGFSVALFTQCQSPTGGWIPQILMDVMAPEYSKLCLAALDDGIPGVEGTRAWWNSFLDFLQQQGRILLTGIPDAELISAYEERLQIKLRQLGIQSQ